MDKLPNYRTDFRSIRDEVSAEEWQARVELAACYRLIDTYGMTDLTYNHITLRVPGPQHHLLIWQHKRCCNDRLKPPPKRTFNL